MGYPLADEAPESAAMHANRGRTGWLGNPVALVSMAFP